MRYCRRTFLLGAPECDTVVELSSRELQNAKLSSNFPPRSYFRRTTLKYRIGKNFFRAPTELPTDPRQRSRRSARRAVGIVQRPYIDCTPISQTLTRTIPGRHTPSLQASSGLGGIREAKTILLPELQILSLSSTLASRSSKKQQLS